MAKQCMKHVSFITIYVLGDGCNPEWTILPYLPSKSLKMLNSIVLFMYKYNMFQGLVLINYLPDKKV